MNMELAVLDKVLSVWSLLPPWQPSGGWAKFYFTHLWGVLCIGSLQILIPFSSFFFGQQGWEAKNYIPKMLLQLGSRCGPGSGDAVQDLESRYERCRAAAREKTGISDKCVWGWGGRRRRVRMWFFWDSLAEITVSI